MAARKRINPDHFTDLFLLALWWQTRDSRLHDRFTTVDAVTNIFVSLGVLDAQLKTGLRKDTHLQWHFRCRLDPFWLSDGGLSIAQDRAATKRPMFVRHDMARGDVNRERMLRDMRIYISVAGEHLAATLEARYAPLLMAERYLAKREEMKATFEAEVPDKKRHFVRKAYQAKCEGGKG